jgi:hypothetical protein
MSNIYKRLPIDLQDKVDTYIFDKDRIYFDYCESLMFELRCYFDRCGMCDAMRKNNMGNGYQYSITCRECNHTEFLLDEYGENICYCNRCCIEFGYADDNDTRRR